MMNGDAQFRVMSKRIREIQFKGNNSKGTHTRVAWECPKDTNKVLTARSAGKTSLMTASKSPVFIG